LSTDDLHKLVEVFKITVNKIVEGVFMPVDAKVLDELIKKHKSAMAVCADYNRYLDEFNIAATRLSAPAISRYRKGKRQMPPVMVEWLDEQQFVHLTPWGGFTVYEEQMPAWFGGILSLLRVGEVEQALSVVEMADFNAKATESEETLPFVRLAALRGVISRHLGDLESTEYAFQDAVDRAVSCAPDFVNRYKTSHLNARREVAEYEYKKGQITKPDYVAMLHEILDEQGQLIESCSHDGDKYLAFKHLMRVGSLLRDEQTFIKAFEGATADGFRGKKSEELAKDVYQWIRHDNDTSGDFDNALGFIRLFDVAKTLQ
jgi:hypothetical protein